jgi:nucleotidyltransferase/DNA polymerase involved in DNA repair
MARVDQVAGIDQKNATKLRKVGVRTAKGLSKTASTRTGRSELSRLTGIDSRRLQLWVNHSDLLAVRGVGAEYAELLVSAGVDTVRDLRRRNPTALLAKIIALNGQRNVVQRLPTESMVEGWIEAAGTVEPTI